MLTCSPATLKQVRALICISHRVRPLRGTTKLVPSGACGRLWSLWTVPLIDIVPKGGSTCKSTCILYTQQHQQPPPESLARRTSGAAGIRKSWEEEERDIGESEILSAPSTLCLQYSTGPVVVRLAI